MYYHNAIAAFVCILLLAPVQTHADSWAAPTPIVAASADGQRIVRIVPGEAGGGSVARATYYLRDEAEDAYKPRRTIELANRVSPVNAYLNNDGALVILDNWGNVGYGTVIVMFDREGRRLASYELEDFYTEARLGEILTTVSSRWWRCPSVQPWINDGEFWVMDAFGGEFRFDLHDGSYEYQASGGDCNGRSGLARGHVPGKPVIEKVRSGEDK